ncbi:Acetolactate synthase large subunit [Actinokineospora spheciospongiae]|uniref:Acetolactate synthase large subunit n=1 Tax=Actinokineospora spheciospongiae TaxID=909613 RepID=W7IW36_9PSEU|nr:thiamine pyrophosphate-binding protein [Actinokineospora spheciospongiae]EWC61032.1 Acetolactate synthase large subunit [Actinokineospora spheciospongiae]
MRERDTVAGHLAATLADLGVGHVFGIGGANIEDVTAAVARHPALTGVPAKHEFAAVAMADGCARTGNRLGVVVATSGGGALNLLAGLAEAHAARVPVLALVGQPPTGQEGRGAFQDTSGKAGSPDARRVFAAVTRFCARVDDPAALGPALSGAVAAARRGGPAALLLPKDVQCAVVDAPRGCPPPGPPDSDGGRTRARVRALVGRVRAAGGEVLVIAEDGVARADARAESARLIDRLDASIAVAPDARDVFDNHDPRFVGVVGVMGHPAVRGHAERADLCLLVGTRLPLVARAGIEDALAGVPLVCFGRAEPFVGPCHRLTGDLRRELALLAASLADAGAAPRPGPAPRAAARPAAPRPENVLFGRRGGRRRRPARRRGRVRGRGQHRRGRRPPPARAAPRRGRFVVALGMGGMGHSFGAAIGAAFARGRRCHAIAGDGAFFMHGMEVHTAVEHHLPVTFIVFDNNAHGMCPTREELFLDGVDTGNRFRRSHLGAGMAAMFPGLDARHVDTAADLHRALVDIDAGRAPAFVSIECPRRAGRVGR